METKKCNSCLENKNITEFYSNGYTPKGSKKYKPKCKKCELYHKNKSHRDKLTTILNEQNRKYECEICGYNKNYAAIVFHHSTEEKNFEINHGKSLSYAKLFHEVSICDVLCSNCHAEAHHPLHMVSEVNRT